MKSIDDPLLFGMICLVVFVIGLIINYQIIESATKSVAIRDQLILQNKLLIALLKKNGVAIEDIERIVEPPPTEKRPSAYEMLRAEAIETSNPIE